jgi:OHCU decarboxylase
MTNAIAQHLNNLSAAERSATLEACCAAKAWVTGMIDCEFQDDADVVQRATDVWNQLGQNDWLEAFEAHPRIGDVDSLRAKFANTKTTAASEQAGVDSADEATLQRLANANDEYFDKFDFLFIVCATGKSAAEMLDILEQRLPNDRATELANAAAEQLKITLIRLRKLIP